MGLGNPTTSTVACVDIMESSIVNDPSSNAVRFRNRIFKHVIHNRDILGYPKGVNKTPYMFVSNDLSGIFMEFVRLINEHKHHQEIKEIWRDLMGILKLLILSYDDVRCEHGCCGFWHSIDKEVFVSMRKMLKEKLKESIDSTENLE
jgi:hypothetical protein